MGGNEWVLNLSRVVKSRGDAYTPRMNTPTPAKEFSALPLVGSDEGRLFMAMKMFELGRATLSQAAEVAGYSVRGFMDVLGHHGIPVANYPASELAAETAW